ncbi:hypothetical protein [Nocardia sp. CA-145437]
MTSAQGILWRLVRIPLIPVVLYLVLRPVMALMATSPSPRS